MKDRKRTSQIRVQDSNYKHKKKKSTWRGHIRHQTFFFFTLKGYRLREKKVLKKFRLSPDPVKKTVGEI